MSSIRRFFVPGRFDRRVVIDLPDRADREEILKIHGTKKPFAEDVDLKVIAERTPGFSGADLYSLMNESAILAARENRTKVSQYDLIRAIEKVMLGPERKSHILSKQEKKITAYHEAGHALVSSVLAHADPVHKISIISRGRAAGYTLHLPLEDRRLQSKKEFLDDIAVSLGGYVAEKMIFGDVTTGPSNDLAGFHRSRARYGGEIRNVRKSRRFGARRHGRQTSIRKGNGRARLFGKKRRGYRYRSSKNYVRRLQARGESHQRQKKSSGRHRRTPYRNGNNRARRI